MSGGDAAGYGARLRLAWRAHGLSQLQLAGMAGVSRQSVSVVESGCLTRRCGSLSRWPARWAGPSRSCSAPKTRWRRSRRRRVAPPGGTGARVTLAAMADGYVALPLRGVTASRGGILPAGGLIAGDGHDPGQVSRTVRPIGPPRPTLLAAGAVIRRCRCWRPRSGCLTRRSGSPGGRAGLSPGLLVRRDAPRRPNLRESRPTPTHHLPSPAAVPRRCPVRTTHALPRSMHSGGHHGRPTSRWRLTAAAMASRSS